MITFFELEPRDISLLSDGDLREMVARLCEAELNQQKCVLMGGAQEAADGGLDVHVKDAQIVNDEGFVPRQNAGFQVKKNSMSQAACVKEMFHKGKIKNVIDELAHKKGAYIIASGFDDCSVTMLSSRVKGMENAVKHLINKDDLLLDFYGRDRLCQWLRRSPGVSLWVRSKINKPLSGWKPFSNWAATPSSIKDEFIFDEHPCVIDKNSNSNVPIPILDGIKLVRNKLRNNQVVRLIGLSGVGKTRFAQALFEENDCIDALPSKNVIYADLGNDLNPRAQELIEYLIFNEHAVYLILDNCPPDIHRKLQKQVEDSITKLSLLTIEYDISDDLPEQTEVILIEPSSEETISKLIQIRFPNLGPVNSNKISEFSGGNARIAIALASRVKYGESLSNFSDEALFTRLFDQRKGDSKSLLKSAEILSLVYSFNVSKTEFNNELNVLAQIGGVTRQTLYTDHAELLRRQISQKRGDWRAVMPHAIANKLARKALENISYDEINEHLFKTENYRLLRSCAHRLSYLHDFEIAIQLANSWILKDGPLNNFDNYSNDFQLTLGYITPIIPEVVLEKIEKKCVSHDFCSRYNPNFYFFVTLLRKLSYEENNFERCVNLLIKFAETEKSNENNNSIVYQIESLFHLHLSGTLSTPKQRQTILNRLLNSGNSKQLEIAKKLFHSAFKTSGWSYVGDFSFGARTRNYGWAPKTQEDVLFWYQGFIDLLLPFLASDNNYEKEYSKSILTENFRSLWSFAKCFEIIEQIIIKYAANGIWPDMWLSIKKTIYLDRSRLSPIQLESLKWLEEFTAPSNLKTDIEAYVLKTTWVHKESVEFEMPKVHNKIIHLGISASTDIETLKSMGSKLWEKYIDSLFYFGQGIAQGAKDQYSTFEYLVTIMQDQKLETINPSLFEGYLITVQKSNYDLFLKLLKRVSDINELKPHFINFLNNESINKWSIKELIRLAKNNELKAPQFEMLNRYDLQESISDIDMLKLLTSLNELDNGIFYTIKILSVRFRNDKKSHYKPNYKLLSLGRLAIIKLLSMDNYKIQWNELDGWEYLLEKCLSLNTPVDEASGIMNLFLNAIESNRIYIENIPELRNILIQNFPELILDNFLSDEQISDYHLIQIFKHDTSEEKVSALNLVNLDRFENLVKANQNKIEKIATYVSPFILDNSVNQKYDKPFKVKLSNHIKKLIEIAENKHKIIEIIFSSIEPNSWGRPLSEILEDRLKACLELLQLVSIDLINLVKEKLDKLQEHIDKTREEETKDIIQREQSFE